MDANGKWKVATPIASNRTECGDVDHVHDFKMARWMDEL